MTNKAYLTEGSVLSHLMKLSIPALIGIVCTFSFIIVDTYFISLVGQGSLTAISYATPVIDFIIGIAIGIGIAISSVVARKIGAGQFQEVQKYLRHSIMLCLLLSIVISIVGILSIDFVFSALGANKDVLPRIYSFMVIWYLSVFLLFMAFLITSALRAYGQAKWPAIVQILMALINVILDPIFIFLLHLDIMGAAIAGAISRVIGIIILIRILIKSGLVSFGFKDKISEILASWREAFSISIPASITNIIGPISSLWITYLLSKCSQAAVAGFGIASKAQMIAVIPMFVLSSSIGPIVGQNYTANQVGRSLQALKICIIFSIIWGVTITIALAILAPYVSMLFSDNAETLMVSNMYMYIIPVSYIGWGIIMMVNANFNALGHPKRSTFISFVRMILVFIPMSVLFSYLFNYIGVFVAFMISTLLVAVFAYIWAIKDYDAKLK